MNTVIYLIRHAEKDLYWQQRDILRPLTKSGLEQAERLGNQTELQDVDIIYASPYVRTIDTIKPLASKLNLEIKDINAFREREIGNKDDKTPVYLREQWRDFAFKWPGGESLYEVQQRGVKKLKGIIAEHPGKKIIIVTHMASIGTILNYYDSSFDQEKYRHMTSPDIWKLEFKDEKFINMNRIPFDFNII